MIDWSNGDLVILGTLEELNLPLVRPSTPEKEFKEEIPTFDYQDFGEIEDTEDNPVSVAESVIHEPNQSMLGVESIPFKAIRGRAVSLPRRFSVRSDGPVANSSIRKSIASYAINTGNTSFNSKRNRGSTIISDTGSETLHKLGDNPSLSPNGSNQILDMLRLRAQDS